LTRSSHQPSSLIIQADIGKMTIMDYFIAVIILRGLS
jgi:hypothetical protein